MPDRPPRQNEDDIERTIDEESEVDEASLESFPASDPPGAGARTVNPAKEREEAESDADDGDA